MENLTNKTPLKPNWLASLARVLAVRLARGDKRLLSRPRSETVLELSGICDLHQTTKLLLASTTVLASCLGGQLSDKRIKRLTSLLIIRSTGVPNPT